MLRPADTVYQAEKLVGVERFAHYTDVAAAVCLEVGSSRSVGGESDRRYAAAGDVYAPQLAALSDED